MRDRRWYRWPQGYVENYVPWWVILRRLVFWPLLLIGRVISFVAVLGGFGWRDAVNEWKSG